MTIIPDQQTAEQARAEQVATDLEHLAAFVRGNPDLADEIGHQRFLMYLDRVDSRTAIADIARRARRSGATMRKEVIGEFAGAVLSFGGIDFKVYADREQVCERVVVGTREVTEEVPDPAALAEVPKVEQTRTEEIVEWRCTPLIAADDTPATEDRTAEVAAR